MYFFGAGCACDLEEFEESLRFLDGPYVQGKIPVKKEELIGYCRRGSGTFAVLLDGHRDWKLKYNRD